MIMTLMRDCKQTIVAIANPRYEDGDEDIAIHIGSVGETWPTLLTPPGREHCGDWRWLQSAVVVRC
jgi:hypothetical protein